MEKQLTGVRLTPDNAIYLKLVSTGIGWSKSSLIDAIISTYRAEHPEMYERAMARMKEIQNELEGGK